MKFVGFSRMLPDNGKQCEDLQNLLPKFAKMPDLSEPEQFIHYSIYLFNPLLALENRRPERASARARKKRTVGRNSPVTVVRTLSAPPVHLAVAGFASEN